jgi:bacteriorhodopsin
MINNVKLTTDLSIIIQIITGIIGLEGLFINVTEKHEILKNVLTLEMIVQVIELIVYIYFLRIMTTTSVHKMAEIRYYDWFISTPVMLLTTIILYKYEEHMENNIEKNLEFWDFIKTNKDNIITIFVCNFFMLLFGYLGEIGAIDIVTSLILGFIFFGMTFYTIYKNYAIHSKNAMKLFYFILIIWGIYGIAALTPHHIKNNMFNILDIFAKNFFGVYLYYRINNVSQ